MASQPKQFYEFGPYRIDPALGRLLRGNTPIPLPPKALDLLLLLVRNPNRVLPKTELMEALWPDTFVEDANLTQHVFTLRKALGAQPGGEPYIETVPRRGYCFAAQVREIAQPESPHQTKLELPSDPALPSPREALPSVAFDGERKQATVLHCGTANAASLAERLGPEGLHDLMQRVSEMASEEICRYEGILRHRPPDEFVAMFGARVVHEDDARRAVLAALGIQRRLLALVPAGAAGDEGPVVRIGIHTGPVVVSRRADDRGIEYSAVGETMRIADLLQQVAEAGTVLVSDVTRRAVEGYVQVAPIESRAAGVTVFRVVGMAPAAVARPARLTRTFARFVGRLHEVALLKDLAGQALGGKGQVVSLVGEPGMGKSRLVHEFSQAVSAGGGVTLLEGRCVSYGSLVPYLPLGDLIRTYCGVSERDPESHRSAVDRAVRETDLPPEAGEWLLRLIGVAETETALETLSPEAIKTRTFDVLRTLFLKASTHRPLVIIVEDVHWIDRTSEEFLTTLVERLVAARVMLVATHRPGYRAPWMDRSYVTQITLPPLTAADSAALVNSVDRGQRLSQVVSAAILAKAEGNPFFLEELARAVVEHGPEAQGIPDTVHAVIMARIDRLANGAKQLVQTASVLGREVPLRLLRRVCRNTAQFDADLMELCRLEFLYERPGGDEPVFVFKHALTQDVAYDSLLARRRQDLHLEAARALEDLYSHRLDEITAALAYHYTRTELVDEAVTCLIHAADQAARVYANAEAILHLDLAQRRLERLPEGPARDRRTLHVALRHAHSLYFLGRFRASVEVLLPHAARLARLNDPALTAGYSFWLGHMYSRLGDQHRARDSAARAIEAATRAGDEETLGKAHGVLALEGHWSGNTVDGIAHGDASVHLLGTRPNQRWWLGMAHFYVALNHFLAGDFEAALAAAGRADEVGKDIGDPRLQTYAGFAAGWVEASRGNHDAAIAACRNSREQAPDRVSRAYASMLLGYALLEYGEHAQARMLLEPIVSEFEAFGFPQWHGFASTLTAETYRLDARLDLAIAFVDRGLEVTTRAEYWYGVGFAQRVRARIARDRGAVEDAAAALDRAACTFERIGATFEAARTRLEITALAGCAGGRTSVTRAPAATGS